MADAQALSAVQALTTIVLGGLLGTIGQGSRAVVGMKKMNDDQAAPSNDDLFSASRLVVSLMIGFVAGVVATFSIGLGKLATFDGNVSLLMGIAAAGYVGSDFIEAFATTLGKAPRPDLDALDQIPIVVPSASGRTVATTPAAITQETTLSGRVSIFGGPDDLGVQADEGLALMDEGDIAAYPDLFLPRQPDMTTGLARRLNPETSYIACRWEYDKTPRRHLRQIKVRVVNTATGASESAQPVDWGPSALTGRVADISPGLAGRLGLVTDQTCSVLVPLPPGAITPDVTGSAAHLKVLSEDEIRKIFGAFEYRESTHRGAIEILGPWPEANIETVEIPELSQLVEGGKLKCHRLIAEPLAAAFKEVAKRDLLDRIVHFDGLWVPRHKCWNPSRNLSSHSWGIAFDINASWNGYGCEPPPKGATGSVAELVPIFESFGFAWGGDFHPDNARDGMHFEYCRKALTA